jgi:serine/threonine-protein phosphatase 5
MKEKINMMTNFLLFFSSAIEAEYDGPHLEADGRVTKEFMLALLPRFENQKQLHKKYAYQV